MNIENFNIFESDLSGTSLIEASAGTGKTYSISGIFIRKVLEGDIEKVEDAVIVTFTDAAAGEIRERLRKVAEEAIEGFEGEQAGIPAEGLIGDAIKKFGIDLCCSKIPILRQLIGDFDCAPISTIHSFCNRILAEYPVQTMTAMRSSIGAIDSNLVLSLIEEFWEQQLPQYPLCAVNFLCESSRNKPSDYLSLVEKFLSSPETKILGHEDLRLTNETVENFIKASEDFSVLWDNHSSTALKIVTDAMLDGTLNGNKYRANCMNKAQEEITIWVSRGAGLDIPDNALQKISMTYLEGATKKNRVAPAWHDIFGAAEEVKKFHDELIPAIENFRKSIILEIFYYVKEKFEAIKAERGQYDYNDLISKVYHALHDGPNAESFTQTLRDRYRNAMIDEFQDTDLQQFNIFKRIFTNGDSSLILIGDPKQAIYSFRGGDIYAYVASRDIADNFYSMGTSYRSEERKIKSINAILGHSDTPFLADFIEYRPVNSGFGGRKLLNRRKQEDGGFHFINACPGETFTNKSEAQQFFEGVSADDIVRQLNEGSFDSGEKVNPSDIAVLVRDNEQVERFCRILRKRKVPCSAISNRSVWDSEIFYELLLALEAVDRPSPARVKAFFAGKIFCLRKFINDEETLETYLNKFKTLQNKFLTEGLAKMLSSFESILQFRNVLARSESAWRSLADYEHLTEIFANLAAEREMNITELIQACNSVTIRKDLESISDSRSEGRSNAVRVMTVHHSKGLEFPIVYLPYTTFGTKKCPSEPHYHIKNKDNSWELVWDFQPDGEARSQADSEALSEDLRLFYVAITRAVNKTYATFSHLESAFSSALGYLLTGKQFASKKAWKDIPCEQIEACFDRICRGHGSLTWETIAAFNGDQYSNDDEEVISEELKFSEFNYFSQRKKQQLSFSAISEKLTLEDHLSPQFPKGELKGSSQFGDFLHAIMERINFANPEANLDKVLEEQATIYGVEDHIDGHIDKIKEMVITTCSRNLGGDYNLRLSDKDNRYAIEMEFTLCSEDEYSIKALREVFKRHAQKPIIQKLVESMSFEEDIKSSTETFTKGFIDLMAFDGERYHVIDWKSNKLAKDGENYTSKLIEDSMNEHAYTLQYHLYCAALSSYLRTRLPDYEISKHLGGAYYVFMRGQSDGGGIFFDKPSDELILDLERFFSFAEKNELEFAQ